METNTITAKIGTTLYKTEISRGEMRWVADEPEPFGANLGPTPYDYLLSALGGCIAMTIRMYIDRKGWDVHSITVNLHQHRAHALDCRECESESGFVHLIKKELIFEGNIDERQHKRLNEIAEKCPVHKTLTNEINISLTQSVLKKRAKKRQIPWVREVCIII